ncbi:MAG: hypothetical protein RL020_1262 [Pseudomonadota bacterium]|jgi:bacillolysin
MLKTRSSQRHFILMFVLPVLTACVSDNALTQTTGSCPPLTSQASEQPKYLAQAQTYLKANPGSHRVTDPCTELIFARERIDELQQKHVRFQQSYQGIPVWGQQIIVHFNAQDVVTSTTGSIQPITQKISIEPRIDKSIAANTAANALGEGARANDNKLSIYQHDGMPHLVHVVDVMQSMRRTMVFVDADTGLVLNQISASPNRN